MKTVDLYPPSYRRILVTAGSVRRRVRRDYVRLCSLLMSKRAPAYDFATIRTLEFFFNARGRFPRFDIGSEQSVTLEHHPIIRGRV